MPRFFNTTGPCVAGKHYMLPPQDRVGKIERLIEREQYFVIHAPRQSGKTTFLRSLADEVNQDGERIALYVSLEEAQPFPRPEEAIPAIIGAIGRSGAACLPSADDDVGASTNGRESSLALRVFLQDLCAALTRPLVLLFDEVDCLTDDALISFLRQLRYGYVDRSSTPFPSTIALVGMRNIRDYKASIRPDRETLGTASPFNIAAESLTLPNFTREEIAQLYAQHMEETGQVFEPTAVDLAYNLTCGQPWLVNALAADCVDELVPDPATPVTVEHVDAAKEELILKRPTHLDSLMERLREQRVQRVIEPVLTGDLLTVDPSHDDYQYVVDLGLLRLDQGSVVVSNAIYREIIPRYLNALTQTDGRLPGLGAFATADGGVDMAALLRAFQQFWRENSEIWLDRYHYREAGPQLVLQSYLQRIFNGAGAIDREYSAGTGRVDLHVRRGPHRYAIELKSVRPHQGLERVKSEGCEQLWQYLDRLGLDEGYLLIFDQRPGQSWDERIFEEDVEHEGKRIKVFGA